MSEEIVLKQGRVPSGTLSVTLLGSLLSLTTDAVLMFGEDGIIGLANEVASRLFRSLPGGLVGADVRMLFPPQATAIASHGPLEETLPFAFDGSSVPVMCEGSVRGHGMLVIRCNRVDVSKDERFAYVLVAHEVDASAEQDQLYSEVARANRRLSGTLRIVLSTLDSLDIGTLFDRILDEVTDTMDAWGTVAYMAEEDGYRLRGATKSLERVSLPFLLENDNVMVDWAARAGSTIRLQVKRPSRDVLRSGEGVRGQLVVEYAGTTAMVPSSHMPPFASSEVVPVWFGGRMIALVVVGWRNSYRLREDDAQLLDSVAEYLSVQLAGALATLRAQHAEQLEVLETTLRERLLAAPEMNRQLAEEVFATASEELGTTLVPIAGNLHQPATIATFPDGTLASVPLDVRALGDEARDGCVLQLSGIPGLVSRLEGLGQPSRGVLVLVGELDDVYQAFLLLHGEELFLERADLALLERLVEDIEEVGAGVRARMRDKHIADALQGGMRNDLQRVEGVTAAGLYSSATEAAFVGGDFYDLIRLPERRACVILGDVSGKGVEAASVSSAVKTAIAAYAWEGLTPARMLRSLNDFLMGFSRVETFATIFVGVLDVPTGNLVYCSAGHPPALLARASSGEFEWLSVQSGVVGAFENMRYVDGTVQMRESDTLVLYTDGVTEARSPDGSFFGEDGLRELVARQVNGDVETLPRRLQEQLAAYAGGSLDDDVAIVALRYDGLGEPAS